MLEHQYHDQHEKRQAQIFRGAEVSGVVPSPEGIDAHGDQAQADGQNHGARDHSREKSAQRFQEKAQHRLKQTADDRRAHNGPIGDDSAAHGGRHAVEYADEAGGRPHDDGNFATDRAHGKKLYQSDDARHQHGVL